MKRTDRPGFGLSLGPVISPRGALGQPPVPTWDLLTPRPPPGTCDPQVNSAQHLEQRLFIYFILHFVAILSRAKIHVTSSREEGPAGAAEAGGARNQTVPPLPTAPHTGSWGKSFPFQGSLPSTLSPFIFTPDSTACKQRLNLQMNEMGPSQAPGLPRAPAGEAGMASPSGQSAPHGHLEREGLGPNPRSFHYSPNIGNNGNRDWKTSTKHSLWQVPI